MSEQVRVAKAAGVVGVATLASRVMGYARDMVMSWGFGTGPAADAFYVAYRIPNLLRELLAEGSMSAAFIPVFTETLAKESKESARRLANAVFARLLVILAVLTVLGIIFAPYVVKLVAWGWAYKAEHDKYLLGVTLTRIMFPYLLFIGLAALAFESTRDEFFCHGEPLWEIVRWFGAKEGTDHPAPLCHSAFSVISSEGV